MQQIKQNGHVYLIDAYVMERCLSLLAPSMMTMIIPNINVSFDNLQLHFSTVFCGKIHN